jgi:xylono-1,5-lactonase
MTPLSPLHCVWPAQATLGEGPVWSERRQALFWVDILGRKLHCFTPRGSGARTWAFDEEISVVVERKNHSSLLVALRHQLAFFDPDTGALEKIADVETDRAANRFNDGKCDRDGRLWVGSMDFAARNPTGALYCCDSQREVVRHVDGFTVTNGPTWSLDGRTMYVANTAASRMFAFDFDPAAGVPSNQRLWRKFSDEEGAPDGMTTDVNGNIWVAHWSGGRVTCRSPAGEQLARIDVPTSNTTSCTFGGPDLKTLYITSACVDLTDEQRAREPSAGGLFAIELDVQGLPATQFAG